MVLLAAGTLFIRTAHSQDRLPGTAPLEAGGDLSVQMVAGIDRYLSRELERSLERRAQYWHRDFSSRAAYEKSVEPNRQRFRKYIGAVDERVTIVELEFLATTSSPALVVENDAYRVLAVRWPVFEGVYGEGLYLEPKGDVHACAVAVPDADQTPEMLAGLAPGVAPEHQFARRLAENGCRVLVPVLIDRDDTWSGNPRVWMTNEPHREWIYRQAYQLGRHIIGYEVQKVFAAVDWFQRQAGDEDPNIIVAGYAEGGLIAFYAAAVDPRINTVLVSGYFDSRQRIYDEPIYRNVFTLLHEFGDAEIASLIAPRRLIVEHSPVPQVDGPSAARDGRRAVAAPGMLRTPEYESVRAELERARGLCPIGDVFRPTFELVATSDGKPVGPGSDAALLKTLQSDTLVALAPIGHDARATFDPAVRQHRQINELVEYNQRLLRRSEDARRAFWADAQQTSVEAWQLACKPYRKYFWEEVLGRLPPATLPANPRSRKIGPPGAPMPRGEATKALRRRASAHGVPTGTVGTRERGEAKSWTAYEVMLDVYPDVFAWGYLLVPNDIKPGEQRPVIVCQHGLEGTPADVINDDPNSAAYRTYKAFAARLADRGFITFAPHNPYRGGNTFRQLQRKANPLKLSMFSFIIAQHDRILDWLSDLPFVDPDRIGFYGLSYGGNTAVRVPPILERYAAVVTSGDFNEWITKSVSVDHQYTFLYYGTYEVFEFNLGNTFNHSDMAGLIAPRPFMVERGHHDGVAPDEWVATEYAKVRRLYTQLGIPDRTQIEFFNGPHTIHGVGTFEFFRRHLHWPGR